MRIRVSSCLVAAVFALAGPSSVVSGRSGDELTIDVRDFVALPVTGRPDGRGQTDGMLARVNMLREEPGRGSRFFVNDLNGPLYILDKATKRFTTYLDFNGRDGRPGIFHKLAFDTGFAGGVVSFQFDPEYATNGRFYTVHIEDPALPGTNAPDAANVPGLSVRDYTTTPAVPTPGAIQREGVLVEWTDTNTANTTFEGSARELLRVALNTRIHPLADLTFNPTARRGDAEWRILYISCGDGGSGESRLAMRMNPQRLDTLVGKILRVIPSLSDQRSSSVVSENGRYRIPRDNPFVGVDGARAEIWASGLRNPHRLAWAIDPANGANTRLIANSIGLHTWETVNIVHKGANYGYSLREGNQLLQRDNKTAPLPDPDTIPVQITDTMASGTVVPTYPVIQYGHVPGGGDAIGNGVLYRGTLVPALRGKYVFSDLSTGRLWFADYADMLKTDTKKPQTPAVMHEIKVRWMDAPESPALFDTMFPIVKAAYPVRGGALPNLPGRGTVSGVGRADVHFEADAAGELYLLSKSDGMIRSVVSGN
jgi:hypothetical protein